MTTRPSSGRRAGSRPSRSKTRKPDALAMLKSDHAKVQRLFDEFEKAESGREKRQLATTICDELKLHARLEEDVFYPAVREAIEDEEILAEAEVEHGSAKALIAKIESSGPSDACFDALVKVLGEYIKHHVKEEEGEMFKQIRRSDLDVAALGERIQQYKGAAGEEVEPD